MKIDSIRTFAKFYFRSFTENQIPIRAAALTYVFILSIIPAIGVCLYLISLFLDMQEIQVKARDLLVSNLASGPSSSLANYIDGFLSNTSFRSMGLFGFVTLFVTSVFLITAVEDAVNHVWQIPIAKNLFTRVKAFLLLFIFGPLTIGFSLFVTTVVEPYVPQLFIGLKFASILVASFLFTGIYKILPNTKVQLKYAFVAGLIVALASNLAKGGFTLYTTQTAFYKTIYGSLAVLPLFLIWIYLNWLIFLAGCQFLVLLQNRKNLKAVGNKKQWALGSLFQSDRFALVEQVYQLLKAKEYSRTRLLRTLNQPIYRVDSAISWLQNHGIVHWRREKLRKHYRLTEKGQKMTNKDIWRIVFGRDIETL